MTTRRPNHRVNIKKNANKKFGGMMMKKRILSLLLVFSLISTICFKVNVNAESNNQTIKDAANMNLSTGNLFKKTSKDNALNDEKRTLLGDNLFEQEPNNTFQTANDLPIKKHMIGTFGDNTDVDMFKVVINADGLFKVKTTTNKEYSSLPGAVLYDKNGAHEETVYIDHDDDKTTIYEYTVTSGIYYISVSNMKNVSIQEPYILSTSFFPTVYPPKVNSISDRDTKITGRATTNSKVYIFANKKPLNSGGTHVCDNKFSVKIKPLKAGTKVTAYVVYSDKKSEVVTLTVSDKTPPKTLKVNKITSKTKSITGKTEASAFVEVKKGKKLLGKAKANKKGLYKINIKPQKKGTKLTIIAKDKAKNSKTINVKVK